MREKYSRHGEGVGDNGREEVGGGCEGGGKGRGGNVTGAREGGADKRTLVLPTRWKRPYNNFICIPLEI